MWVCPSCMMENDDNDLNCYMCGEKRPHIAQVRKPKAVQVESAPRGPVAEPETESILVRVQPEASVVAEIEMPVAKPVVHTPPESPVYPQEDKTSPTLVFETEEEAAEEAETTIVNPFSWQYDPPVTVPETEDENAEESITAEPGEEYEEMNPQPAPSLPPQAPVEDVFGIFSSAFRQESQTEPLQRPGFVQPPYNPPMPPVSGQGNTPVSGQGNTPVYKKRKSSAESKVFSFASVLFVVALFVWIFALGFLGVVHFFEGNADGISDILERLRYIFESKIAELTEIEIPALFDKFMNFVGSL